MTWQSQMTPAALRPRSASLAAVVLLLTPAALLGASAMRAHGLAKSVAVGVCVTLIIEGLYLLSPHSPNRALGSRLVFAFYATAYLVLRFNNPDLSSPFTHASLAAVLLVPVALFARYEVSAAGGSGRHAKFLVRKLLARDDWPATFAEYPAIPEVRGLREALRDDAGPVLPLLAHEDGRIQVAALTALEFQPVWRKGQAEAVIQRANFTDEPAVRAAAVSALGRVSKPRHLACLLPFLRDHPAAVRHAAAAAFLWDAARRWPEIRSAVRSALADSQAARDGPLPCSSALPPAALDDLIVWSAESGSVGKRATQTLVRHCKKAIQEDGSAEAIRRVTCLVTHPKVPPAIRVEVAHRLRDANEFPTEIAARLVGPGSPTMLRVIAAGALLSQGNDEQAVEALRQAARQPNREIALAAAGTIQRFLGVDMGLPVGGQLPPSNSREATEVTRKVLTWASDPGPQTETETPADAVIPAPTDAAYF